MNVGESTDIRAGERGNKKKGLKGLTQYIKVMPKYL